MKYDVDSIRWKIEDRNFHAERSSRYDQDQKNSGEIFKKYKDIPFIEKLKRNHCGIVLDFGCGTGVFTIELADRDLNTVAFDHSKEMVNIARKKINNYKKVEFLIADCEYLPFKSKAFQGVICNEVLHHLPDYEKALKEMVRVSNGGGMLYIAEPEARTPMLNQFLNTLVSTIWIIRGAASSIKIELKSPERTIPGEIINEILTQNGITTILNYCASFPAVPFMSSDMRYYLSVLISPLRFFSKGTIFFIEGIKK